MYFIFSIKICSKVHEHERDKLSSISIFLKNIKIELIVL